MVTTWTTIKQLQSGEVSKYVNVLLAALTRDFMFFMTKENSKYAWHRKFFPLATRVLTFNPPTVIL